MREGETPVPIPNTTVKTFTAEKKDYCITISVITGKGYREVIMDSTTDSHAVWPYKVENNLVAFIPTIQSARSLQSAAR